MKVKTINMSHEERFKKLENVRRTLVFLNQAKNEVVGTICNYDEIFNFSNEIDIGDVTPIVDMYIEQHKPDNIPTHNDIDYALAYIRQVIDTIETKYMGVMQFPYAPISKLNYVRLLINTYCKADITQSEKQELDFNIRKNIFAQFPTN